MKYNNMFQLHFWHKVVLLVFMNCILACSLLVVPVLRTMVDDISLPPYSLWLGKYIQVIFLGWVCVYGLTIWWLKNELIRKQCKNVWFYMLLGTPIVLLFLVWPIASADMFNYILSGRTFSVYGLNPYTTPHDMVSQDVFYNYTVVQWRDTPSPYGPLWTLVITGCTYLTQNFFLGSVYTVKMISVLAWVVITWVSIRMTKNTNFSMVLLYALVANPILLWEGIVNGHNDIVFIACLFLMIYFFSGKKFKTGVVFWMLSVWLKYISLLLLPGLIMYGWRKTTMKDRLQLVLLFVVGSWLLFLPFGGISQALPGLIEQGTQAYLLSYYTLLPYFLSFFIGEAWLYHVVRILFLVLYMYAVWQFFTSKKDTPTFQRHALQVMSLYIFVAVTWWQPWYLLWLLPFIVMDNKPSYYLWLWMLVVLGFCSYVLPVAWVLFLLTVIVILGFIFKNTFQHYGIIVAKK